MKRRRDDVAVHCRGTVHFDCHTRDCIESNILIHQHNLILLIIDESGMRCYWPQK